MKSVVNQQRCKESTLNEASVAGFECLVCVKACMKWRCVLLWTHRHLKSCNLLQIIREGRLLHVLIPLYVYSECRHLLGR